MSIQRRFSKRCLTIAMTRPKLCRESRCNETVIGVSKVPNLQGNYQMNSKILLSLAAVAMLSVAACSKPETPPEASTDTAPAAEVVVPAAPAAPVAVPAEPAMAPATNTTAITPEQAMQAVQAQAASMTDAQKAETIAAARKAAVDAATTQGLTAEQIKQAGDMAEQATKQMLGVQ